MRKILKRKIRKIKKKDFWLLDKRFFLLIVLVFSFVWTNQLARTSSAQTGYVSIFQSKYDFLKYKIQGDADWKPNGWGSGEYLGDIPTIKGGAVLEYDSGNVLWSMNLKQRTATASLSKLATVETALDIVDSNHLITVSDNSAGQIPTILGLKTGERLTLDEAVSAAIMTSANDATETIADSLGREYGIGPDGFMDLVNLKLKKIGAVESHFVTPTGLDDPSHYSTVYDLAIIAHEAMSNYPLIAQDASTIYKKLDQNQNHKTYDLPNWNALLGTYPGVMGLKIGYTENAGYSTIVTAERDGHKLMAIVTGANSLENRDKAAAILLNYGFKMENVDPFDIGQIDLIKRYNDWKQELTGGN